MTQSSEDDVGAQATPSELETRDIDEKLKNEHPDEWKIFEALDEDSGGTLDKDELWCKLAVDGEEQATQLMSMVDTNGDGVIDFREFCEAFDGNERFRMLITADTDWMREVLVGAGFPEDKLGELQTRIDALQKGHGASLAVEELDQLTEDVVNVINPVSHFDAAAARESIANGLNSASFNMATAMMENLDDALKKFQEKKDAEKNHALGIDG